MYFKATNFSRESLDLYLRKADAQPVGSVF